jgi:simple sugar transport system ATP-binding protein
MVYQHFRLVRTMSVAENFVLANPTRSRMVSRRAIERQVRELAERYRLHVHPSARVGDLSIGEQQRVEILKLLYRDVRILILDEPTAVLTPQEAEALFDAVRVLADEGRAIVLVSHKLEDVLRLCERITILRRGERMAQIPAADAEPRTLARLMIGRDIELPTRTRGVAQEGAELTLEGVKVLGERGNEAVRGVDLLVRGGEIVGLAGVAGNGQRELADAIAGLRPVHEGTVRLGDATDITGASVRRRIGAGLAYVPEDRLRVGLAAGLPAWANLSFKKYRHPQYARGPLLSKRRLRKLSEELVSRFDVRGVAEDLPVRLLSGGNLQRMLLAREIADRPRVLVAASLTHGLDVAAIARVHELLLAQREHGTAILLISEDLDELFALSDRIAVMYEGRIVGELPVERADVETIGLMMAGQRPADRADRTGTAAQPSGFSPEPMGTEPP